MLVESAWAGLKFPDDPLKAAIGPRAYLSLPEGKLGVGFETKGLKSVQAPSARGMGAAFVTDALGLDADQKEALFPSNDF